MKTKQWIKKNKNILFIVAVLVVLAFFLVPFSIAPVVETIEWKGNTIDVISITEKEGVPRHTNADQLTIGASASQGRNAQVRGNGAEITLDFKSLDISKYESVEFLFNGNAGVTDPPQRMGASSGLGVGLMKDGKNIYSCSVSASLGNSPKSLTLFKVENKGAGFYRIQSDCGTELIKIEGSDENIKPYLAVQAHTTQGALEHSASAGITIFEIRSTKTQEELQIMPITETLDGITKDKEQQVEIISESSLSQEQKEQVVSTISENQAQKDQLLSYLNQIQQEKEQQQKRILYIIIGGVAVLIIAIISVILARKR